MTNFAEVAQALGFKVKQPVQKERTKRCYKCGNDMRHVEGTNVYVCDGSIVKEDTLPDGTKCSVTKPCGNTVIARV